MSFRRDRKKKSNGSIFVLTYRGSKLDVGQRPNSNGSPRSDSGRRFSCGCITKQDCRASRQPRQPCTNSQDINILAAEQSWHWEVSVNFHSVYECEDVITVRAKCEG